MGTASARNNFDFSEKNSRKASQRVPSKSTAEKSDPEKTAVPLKEFVQTAIKDISSKDSRYQGVSYSNQKAKENISLDQFEDVKVPDDVVVVDDPFSPFKPREPKNRIQVKSSIRSTISI